MTSILEKLALQLGTNYIPTDDEVGIIQDLLSQPTQKLAELKADIKRQEEELKQISVRHDDLALEIASYRALISPTRRLPADVLREIFCHCLPTAHNPVLSPEHAPILLTHICSAWRGIAHTTPALWAAIHIPIPPSTVRRYSDQSQETYSATAGPVVSRRVDAVREWLARSGTLPLSFSVYTGDPARQAIMDRAGPNEYASAFLDILIPLSARWRDACFTMASPHFAQLTQIPADALPLLESLSVAITNPLSAYHLAPNTPLQRVQWKDSGFVRAPRLREVSFLQETYKFNLVPFNWAQLTKLALEGLRFGPIGANMTLPEIVAVLRQCSRLVEARIEVPPTPDTVSEDAITSSVILPSLRYLAVCDGGGCLPSFFDMLRAPLLTHFQYQVHNATSTDASCILLFFQHVGSTLRSLSITSQVFDLEGFVAILQLCPNLVRLSDSTTIGGTNQVPLFNNPNGHLTNELLVRMNSREADYLVPNLEVMEFYSPSAFHDEAILKFIEERQDGLSPTLSKLKRVSLRFSRTKYVDIAAELRDHVDGGLKLDLAYVQRLSKGPFSVIDGVRPPHMDFPGIDNMYLL